MIICVKKRVEIDNGRTNPSHHDNKEKMVKKEKHGTKNVHHEFEKEGKPKEFHTWNDEVMVDLGFEANLAHFQIEVEGRRVFSWKSSQTNFGLVRFLLK